MQHAVSTVDERVFVTVEIPDAAGLGLAHVVRDTTEPKRLELSSLRVRRHHVANLENSLFILIGLFLAFPVERPVICDLQVAEREVDSQRHVDTPALAQIGDQTGSHVHIKLVELDIPIYLPFVVLQLEAAIRQHLNITGSGSHRPIQRMVTRIDVRVYREADRQILVTVAELGHGDLLRVPPGICIGELIGGLVHFDHVVLISALLPGPLNQEVRVVTAEAHPLLGAQVGTDLELDLVVSLFNSISPYFELPADFCSVFFAKKFPHDLHPRTDHNIRE